MKSVLSVLFVVACAEAVNYRLTDKLDTCRATYDVEGDARCTSDPQFAKKCACTCSQLCREDTMMACCKDNGVPDACLHGCTYYIHNTTKVLCDAGGIEDAEGCSQDSSGPDQCGCGKFMDVWSFCSNAGQHQPVVDCCTARNVPEVCMPLCANEPLNITHILETQPLSEVLKCFDKTNKILRCKHDAVLAGGPVDPTPRDPPTVVPIDATWIDIADAYCTRLVAEENKSSSTEEEGA